MAYCLGEDVPLILQGAGKRERLSAEQAARVASLGGTIGKVATGGISPVLLYAGIGLLAYSLAFSGRRRMNW